MKVQWIWCKLVCWFPCCSTRENLSIRVPITTVGLILTKLRWFQLITNRSKVNFDLFWKENQIFGFPCCSTHEDLSIDRYIIFYCITDIDKARVIYFFSRGTNKWTDRHDFGILIWKHIGTQKMSSQSSKLGVRCQLLGICIPGWQGYIIKGIGYRKLSNFSILLFYA